MEVLDNGFLCFPCFLWVCSAERAEYAVDGNGCEVGIRRCFCKEDGKELQGVLVCVPQVIVGPVNPISYTVPMDREERKLTMFHSLWADGRPRTVETMFQ